MGVPAANLESSHSPLARAIEVAGGRDKLATAIGVSGPYVSQWTAGVRSLTPEHCPAIEQTTGVTCDELRPDLVWVRDAANEVLGYVTPVDGADAAYVRQALVEQREPAAIAMADAYALATTEIAEAVQVSHEASGAVHVAIAGSAARFDALEAAKLAEAILDHRALAVDVLPESLRVDFEGAHPFLPIRGTKDGYFELDFACLDHPFVVSFNSEGLESGGCFVGDGASAMVLTRREADALAMALTRGNDGSSLAHIVKLATASMSEAIAVLRGGETSSMKADTVANDLARHVHILLDMHYSYQEHQLRRHGNLRYGYPPKEEAADALSEAARHAVAAMATVRGALSRGEYVNAAGFEDRGEPRNRGFYQGLRNAERMLEKGIADVMLKADAKPAPEPMQRNPLEATAVHPNNDGDECYMTNVRWTLDPESTVRDCLEEASLMLGNAQGVILSNDYERSEDAMSLFIGIAKASVNAAHSKLLQFANN